MTKGIEKTFGSNVKRLKENRDLTQEKMAEAVGLSRRAFASVLDGTIPRTPNLKALAAFLHLPIFTFFLDYGSEDVIPTPMFADIVNRLAKYASDPSALAMIRKDLDFLDKVHEDEQKPKASSQRQR